MINFENYYGILTNAEPEIFNKLFIEKENYEGIKEHGYIYRLIAKKLETRKIIKLLENGYKYYYNIQEDRFYDIDDLKELLENE